MGKGWKTCSICGPLDLSTSRRLPRSTSFSTCPSSSDLRQTGLDEHGRGKVSRGGLPNAAPRCKDGRLQLYHRIILLIILLILLIILNDNFFKELSFFMCLFCGKAWRSRSASSMAASRELSRRNGLGPRHAAPLCLRLRRQELLLLGPQEVLAAHAVWVLELLLSEVIHILKENVLRIVKSFS